MVCPQIWCLPQRIVPTSNPARSSAPPLSQYSESTLQIGPAVNIRRMRGGAQSHLMRCADSNYYVVKFQNNPQHTRVLVNDWLGTRLAEMIGLPVPVADVVDVHPWLIEHSPDCALSFAADKR